MVGKYHIRWWIRRDMPPVLRIEEESYADPWTEGDLLSQMRKTNPSSICMVFETNGEVVGYMVYTLRPRRIEVERFAVLPAWRRKGVGRLMAEKLIGKLGSHRRVKLVARVPDDNVGAHLFARACGFTAKVVPSADRDVYTFTYRVEEVEEVAPRGSARFLYTDEGD